MYHCLDVFYYFACGYVVLLLLLHMITATTTALPLLTHAIMIDIMFPRSCNDNTFLLMIIMLYTYYYDQDHAKDKEELQHIRLMFVFAFDKCYIMCNIVCTCDSDCIR